MLINFTRILTLFWFVAFCDCYECGVRKETKSRPLIVDGDLTYPGQWPWTVSLHKIYTQKTNAISYFCGASLISESRLLTCSHCITETINFDIFAKLGQYNWNDTTEPHGIKRSITQRIMHEDYDESDEKHKLSDADLAILVMDRPVTFTDFIQPVCLPQADQNVVNVYGTVVGYGKTNPSSDASKTPLLLNMKSIDLGKCAVTYEGGYKVLSERNFCAGSMSGIPCSGDSGSGFVSLINNKWTILGIVSFAFGTECKPSDDISFTKVPVFTEWINNNPCYDICPTDTSCVFINGKNECKLSDKVINTWIGEIQNGAFQSAYTWDKENFGKVNSFKLALPHLIKHAYQRNWNNFENVLKFIDGLPYIDDASIGFSVLYDEMKASQQLDNYELTMLAYEVKRFMDLQNYPNIEQKYKDKFENLKANLEEARRHGVNDAGALIRNGNYDRIVSWSKTFSDYESSLSLALPDIIKAAYSRNLNNFDNVLKFTSDLYKFAQVAIGYSALYDEMKSNYDLEIYQSMIFYYQIELMTSYDTYTSVNQKDKDIFNTLQDNLREKSKNGIKESANKIINGNYEQIYSWSKRLATIGNNFDKALPDIIESAYANDLNNAEKIINFLSGLPWIECRAIGYLALYNRMKSNGDLESYQLMMLAYAVKEKMEDSNYPKINQKFKDKYSSIKNDLPSMVRDFIWSSRTSCTIENILFPSFIYSSSYNSIVDDFKRKVFIHKGGKSDEGYTWTFTSSNNGKSFSIKNNLIGEFLFPSVSDVGTNDDRDVFTNRKGTVDSSYWQLIPKPKFGNVFYIFNTELKEYLYVADGDEYKLYTDTKGKTWDNSKFKVDCS